MNNKFYTHGDITEIIISSETHGDKSIFIDTDELERVQSYPTWTLSYSQKDGKVYVKTNVYYKGKSRGVYLHRVITNAYKGKMVDHKNGDTLDNRKCNLRLVSPKGNAQNRAISSLNTSGYRGVSYNTRKKKYQAYVGIDGRKRHLGYFETPEEANEVAVKARIKYLPYCNENTDKPKRAVDVLAERGVEVKCP